MPSSPAHPLAHAIVATIKGIFPAPDGGWHRVRPWREGLEVVVAFTGHAVFCLADDVPDHRLRALGADGFGGAHHPRLVAELAGPRGWIGSLDLLLVARGASTPGPLTPSAPGPSLVPRPDLSGHPRVAYAGRFRDNLVVLGLPEPERTAVAIVGRGVAGLTEISYELEPERRGGGEGRALVAAALRGVPREELAVACVAPGNAASLRSLLGAGFVPIGALQLFRRAGGAAAAR
jgi:hypothetical protein